ncbi:MAG: NADH-quinone oxidoreductase subunit L [Deltaproteobacteria bacterium RIFOXYA12_FULL_58_15]|nr:MAG: NADH-quinone oxidoreductase subunit L [Deltaproteobacteria bacterium RIFOXYA12_FULL_58_15]OGR08798.1 MAG: NADH-quinone oxidoreductase subunit L [Deltaproteobacteria bacterium RIFOXYB12_FULL_58_9]
MVAFIGCATVFCAFLISAWAFWGVWQLAQAGNHEPLSQTLYTWMAAGSLRVDLTFAVDALSGIMILVVTGVGFLIHVYSIGYMSHDPAVARYFAYLNLFCFAMLTLVLGDSLPLMFLGWEGVGLCSYLLIGFWYTDIEKAVAGKKAFVTNRIGDFGFIVAMLLLFRFTGTLTFDGIEKAAAGGTIDVILATAVCLMLFLGATGKSAQIPLFVWLPDAMAGPTPVSALIHAATMVTAGVYMVARMGFLYSMAPVAMLTVAGVGAATALFAATIAVAQNDIKKVLAYSTVSQLGFMFVAAGLGAYAVAVFHLVTHAFFKACLFLGSGSVIHGMSGEQDIRQMGGLLKKQPITAVTFIVATLAITGVPIPFLAGFVSKDAILWNAWMSGHEGAAYASVFANAGKIIWAVAVIAALFTAFYMWRLVFLTFFSGKLRASKEVANHVHESPFTMWFPLVVLAILSLFGGALGWPHIVGGHDWIANWLTPIVGKLPTPEGHFVGLEWTLIGGVTFAALLSFGTAYVLYFKGIHPVAVKLATERPWRWLYLRLSNKWHVDELYEATVIQPLWSTSRLALYEGIDRRVIDWLVNTVGWLGRSLGFVGQLFHSGNIQRYLAIFAIGLAFLLGIYFLPMVKNAVPDDNGTPTPALQVLGGEP